VTSLEPLSELPFVTAELPGIGGEARAAPEDFEVEELPAYAPSGEGAHLFLWVEKRGRNTRDVAREIARAVGISERDVGVAGLKDRRALTRQHLSVPITAAAKAASLSGNGWKVLAAAAHGNKLKTGHLRGNRFRIHVRGCGPQSLERARAIAAALEQRGLPNAFGPQRFGRGGANVGLGRALVRGEDTPEARHARRDRFLRRMTVSAYQAFLFNRVLAQRMEEGLFASAIDGDLMKKSETGGLFVSHDVAAEAPRVARFEISPTGPIFGHRMMEPEGEALARERRVLEAEGLSLASFAALKGDAEGTRRAMRMQARVSVERDADALVLSFALEKGSFATIVLREMMKAEAAAELPED
jgi:tRNA pseudouridine13 synthase